MITTSALINDPRALDFIKDFNELYGRILRKLYVGHVVKSQSLTKLKSGYIREYGISARHFNSIANQLLGMISSRKKIVQHQIEERREHLHKLLKRLKKIDRNREKTKKQIAQLKTYKQKVRIWRQTGRVSRKPRLLKSLQKINLDQLEKDLKNDKFLRHQKLKKFDRLKSRYESLVLQNKSGRFPLCFGTRSLFKKQRQLAKNGYSDHQDWLRDWRYVRANQSYFLGSHDEKWGNQNAQYNPEVKTITLRVPRALRDKHGERVVITNLEFSHRQDELCQAVTHKPVSFRFLTRITKDQKEKLWVQASFQPDIDKTESVRDLGAIGIDINADHIAISECDRFGNPISKESYPFQIQGRSSHQVTAQLGDHIAMITARAAKSKKPIICEQLDFKKKRSALKENGGKGYRRMLSYFCYQKFFQLLLAQCQRKKIKLIAVKAQYTSMIGYYKFLGYSSFTSHELAALAIARRGLRMSERVKSKVSRSGSVRIHDQDEVRAFYQECLVRHNWSFWARHTLHISRHRLENSSKGGYRPVLYHPRHPSGYAVVMGRACDRRFQSRTSPARRVG